MVLDELEFESIAPETTTDHIKKTISLLFWAWFEMNQDRRLTTLHFWFIRRTVKVRDLEGVFEILFGSRYALA